MTSSHSEGDQKRDYVEFVHGLHAAEQGNADAAAASPSPSPRIEASGDDRSGGGGGGDDGSRGKAGRGRESSSVGGSVSSFFGRRKKKSAEAGGGGSGGGGGGGGPSSATAFSPATVREETFADGDALGAAEAPRLEESFTVRVLKLHVQLGTAPQHSLVTRYDVATHRAPHTLCYSLTVPAQEGIGKSAGVTLLAPLPVHVHPLRCAVPLPCVSQPPLLKRCILGRR